MVKSQELDSTWQVEFVGFEFHKTEIAAKDTEETPTSPRSLKNDWMIACHIAQRLFAQKLSWCELLEALNNLVTMVKQCPKRTGSRTDPMLARGHLRATQVKENLSLILISIFNVIMI